MLSDTYSYKGKARWNFNENVPIELWFRNKSGANLKLYILG